MIKIFLTGADKSGWALDTDFRLAKLALGQFAQIVDDVDDCDYIHSIWPTQLFLANSHILKCGKPIVAVFQGDPIRLFEKTPGFYDFCQNVICVAQSTDAEEKLNSLGLSCCKVPYIADLDNFYPIDKDSINLRGITEQHSIPENKYIIGNFMRDTLGLDLSSPKLEKGPDVFLEILKAVTQKIGPDKIHVLLAGPRRHWIIKKLNENNISYSFIGKSIEGDDYPENIQNLSTINRLINISNLILITSRSEGGPRAILETAACKVPLISTPVGIASDVLAPECIFETIPEAMDLILKDYETEYLSSFITIHESNVKSNHSIDAISKLWEKFYQNAEISLLKNQKTVNKNQFTVSKCWLSFKDKYIPKFIRGRLKHKHTLNIWTNGDSSSLDNKDTFIETLTHQLEKRNVRIVYNLTGEVDAHFFIADKFDLNNAVAAIKSTPKAPVVHRIKDDWHKNNYIVEFNKKVGNISVYQSYSNWAKDLQRGIYAVKPCIIRDTVNPEYYHKSERVLWSKDRRTKVLICGRNKKDEITVCKCLDDNINLNKYELSLIGNIPIKFKNIKVINCRVDSKFLGTIMREYDIFICTDFNTNMMLQALACGLPVLFHETILGNEIVGMAGLQFTTDNILSQLNTMREYYEHFLNVINVPSVQEVTERYMEILGFK